MPPNRRDQLALPERVGGALVLDFVNTQDAWLSPPHRREFLRSYDDVVAWALDAEALDAAGAAELRRAAARNPAGARRVHARALVLRDALFSLFTALATGADAPRDAIGAVNVAWLELEARPQLDPAALHGGRTWTGALDRPLGPVLDSAAELLREGPLDRLRQCLGPDGWCGALFLDRTKNRSRRWCSMAVCGNPAKMRARAARRRAQR